MKETDIVIVGAGSAGVAAAVAVARSGLHCVVIDSNPYPGGNATAAEVGTICGAYEYNNGENAKFIANGFVKEFTEIIQKNSGTETMYEHGLWYLPYDTLKYKEISLKYLENSNISFYFNSKIIKIESKTVQIEKVELMSDQKKITFHCKALIDCSGNGISHKFTQKPLIQDEHLQAAALVFQLKNIKEANERKLAFIMMKTLRSGIAKGLLPEYCNRVYIVQGSLNDSRVSLKVGIPIEVLDKPDYDIQLKDSGSEMIHLVFNFLKNNTEAFKFAELEHIADQAGIRTSTRPVGRYILTENDVMNCKKFKNYIALGSWPIEIWKQSHRVDMKHFELGNHYHIPADSLCSIAFDNLFFAGRNISADTGAIASARVIGTCLQTGYAAGILAAAKVQNKTESLAIQEIQNHLNL